MIHPIHVYLAGLLFLLIGVNVWWGYLSDRGKLQRQYRVLGIFAVGMYFLFGGYLFITMPHRTVAVDPNNSPEIQILPD